jgi:hypothetical protein
LVEKLRAHLHFEIEQIDQLLASYSQLLDEARREPPELVELTAIASVLHSFYNGIENLLLAIAKTIDQRLPEGDRWHQELLAQMTRSTELRSPVLSEKLADDLTEFLGFRHFYRHSYSFFLEWSKMAQLATSLYPVWNETKSALLRFDRDQASDSSLPRE